MKNTKNILICLAMALGFVTIQASSRTQAPLGSDSMTHAPKTFTPDKIYNQDGSNVGNYFANSHIATIHNPNLQVENGFTFTDVVEGGMNVPVGKVLIGTMAQFPKKAAPGRPQRLGASMIYLYGIESQE